MNIVEFAKSWYGEYLPETLGASFQRFAAASATIAERIADAPIKILKEAQTASTDGQTIFLPGFYFTSEFYDKLGHTNVYQKPAIAISTINGSTIHEALHILLSHCDMRDQVAHDERAKELIETNAGFRTILNLVEDLFIEHYGSFAFSRLFNFVRSKNVIIFSTNELLSRIATFDEEANQTNLLNVMLCRKNTNNDELEEWGRFQPFVDAFEKAKDLDITSEQRVELALKIFDMFESEEQQEEVNFSSDDRFGSDNTNERGDFNPESDFIDEEEMRQLINSTYLQLVEAIKEFEEAASKLVRTEYEEALNALDRIPGLVYEDLTQRYNSTGRPTLSKEFNSFAQSFRYLYEEKNTLGRPNDTGTKIVKQRLHRILTDNKVLAYHDSKSVVRGKPKVIVLLDASGSTSGRLWEEERKAAYGSFLSMQRAGISIAMYAHTSKGAHYSTQTPCIYGIAAHNMPLGKSNRLTNTSNVNARFAALHGLELKENFDGFAIKFVSECFPSNPGTNLLIVLSDGHPLGGSAYSGPKAMDHTKAVINEVRNRGTKIISISLVEYVYEANNMLYGKEFNVKAWNGQLEKSLQTIMLSLISKK